MPRPKKLTTVKKEKSVKKLVEAPKLAYKLTLFLNGKEYKSEAETLSEAIQKLKPEAYKTKGILRVEYGDKKTDRFLRTFQMRRLFSGGTGLTATIVMQSLCKTVQMMLK